MSKILAFLTCKACRSKNTKEDPSDIDEGVNNPALEPETQLNELKPKTVERLI